MTWKTAAEALASAGLVFEPRTYGLEAHADAPSGRLRLQIGRSSAGGDELSVTRESGIRSWFVRPTLPELVELIALAQRAVAEGRAPSILDALLELDPR